MTKKHYLKITSILILISLILTSCDPSLLNSTKGDLVISFDQSISKDTLEPQIKMDVDSYIIRGTGPDGRTFTPITSNGDDVTISNLFNGDWTITVQGLNEDGIAIGEGSDTVTIVANKVNSAHIEINEFIGDGTLELGVNWPIEDISDPQIVATLSQPNSNISHNLSFSINTNAGTASFNNDYNSGYYILNIALYDGDTTDINNKLIGKSYSLRIVKDNSTAYNLEIKKDDLNLYGEVSVSVANNISSSFEVSLSKTDVTLTEGNTQEFVATANTSGECTYYWYVDGEIQQESSNTFTTPNTLKLGTHSVDVIASKNGIFSSASSKIEIKEFSQSYVNMKIINRQTQAIEKEIVFNYGINNIENMFITEPGDVLPEFGDVQARKITSSSIYSNDRFIILGYNQLIEDSESFANSNIIPQHLAGIQFYFEGGESNNIIFDPDETIAMAHMPFDNFEYFGFDSSFCNDKYITITKIGDIGDQIIGKTNFYNTPINGYPDENMRNENATLIDNYDVEIEFNITRGDDINLVDITLYNNIEGNQNNYNYIAYEGQEIEVNNNVAFSKEGYTFIGWNTEADGSGTSYLIGDTFIVNKTNVNFYAIWAQNEV